MPLNGDVADLAFTLGQSFVCLSRSALAMTLTDESDIAAAATIGDRRMPNAG